MRPSRPATKPVSFGRFRLLEHLGTGGMAVVHRATVDGPHGFSRSVVIKRVLPGLARDQEFMGGLITEARVAALLHHPNIVQVFEFGQIGREYFLAMEFVDGVDLARLLKACKRAGRTLPAGIACFIVREVAAAL